MAKKRKTNLLIQYNGTKPEFLYLLRHDTTNYYKIGWAFDIFERISDLQVGNPMELILIDSCQCDQAEAREDYLHNELVNFKIRGEWYRLEGENLKFVRDYYRNTDFRRSCRLLIENVQTCDKSCYL